jgi:hypothetical protein
MSLASSRRALAKVQIVLASPYQDFQLLLTPCARLEDHGGAGRPAWIAVNYRDRAKPPLLKDLFGNIALWALDDAALAPLSCLTEI